MGQILTEILSHHHADEILKGDWLCYILPKSPSQWLCYILPKFPSQSQLNDRLEI